MTFPPLHSFVMQNCGGGVLCHAYSVCRFVARDSLLVIPPRTPYGAAKAGIYIFIILNKVMDLAIAL